MDTIPGLDRSIDLELHLVDDAMRFVAAQRRTAVVVGGLRHGEALVALARDRADELGLTLEPLWPLDLHGPDIQVRARRTGDGD